MDLGTEIEASLHSHDASNNEFLVHGKASRAASIYFLIVLVVSENGVHHCCPRDENRQFIIGIYIYMRGTEVNRSWSQDR